MFVLADIRHVNPAFFKKTAGDHTCITWSLSDAKIFSTKNEAKVILGELKDKSNLRICALTIKHEPWMPHKYN